MKRQFWRLVVSSFAAVSFAFTAVASAQTYSFNELQSPNDGTAITSVGTLSITDISGGAHFVLTADNAWLGSSSTITRLAFAGSSGTFGNFLGPSLTGGSNGMTFSAGGFTDAGLSFNWSLDLPPPGAVLANNGVLSFDITGSGIDSSDFFTPFMVHIQRLDTASAGVYGQDSIKVTTAVTPIPEPEIYAMLSLGLGLMGWIGRRRKQQAA